MRRGRTSRRKLNLERKLETGTRTMIGTMTPLRSVVLILSTVCFVLFAYLFGYGLAAHSTTGMLIGVGFLGMSALLIWVQTRMWRDTAAPRHH
jgi:hypothetical protein